VDKIKAPEKIEMLLVVITYSTTTSKPEYQNNMTDFTSITSTINMEYNDQNMIMNDIAIINIQNYFGTQDGDALPVGQDLSIIEVENEAHDCVIDVADSQPDEEVLSATLVLEDELSDLALPLGNVTMGIATKALGKGQDAPYCGKFTNCNGIKGDYVTVYDGHGGDECINAIRSFNQDEIMSATNPVDCVREKIRDYRNQKKCNMAHSGSTFVYAKIITENADGSGLGYISIGNVADSELAVYINGERIFMTTPQIAQTPGELDRLTREGRVHTHKKNLEHKPKIHTDNKITMERAYNINFIGMNPIVPTQSLGHNELTGYAPEFKVITFDLEKDAVRVVAGSDGLWDLLNLDIPQDNEAVLKMDADSLCKFAEKKWKQEWKYCTDNRNMEKFNLTKFPSYDDIGIAIYDYSPHQPLEKVEPKHE
jgi:serine/threonine protein phosphatase PrpC